ncbi:MAG TPA: hypothetical protein VEL03_18660 [Streptosporangiaceae bacterium]|nr:hypothetical protein [Streptosporangiaceae bacterium]
MNSTTEAALWSGAALVGGAVLGAWLTGWFTVRVKRRKRVQERRAELYVDILAWVGARMPWLVWEQARMSGKNGPEPAEGQKLPEPDAATAQVNKKRTSYPDTRSIAGRTSTDPDTPYFVSLRARVAVFASHDMARAFDNWVDAYGLTLPAAAEECCERHQKLGKERIADPPADCRSSALRAIAYDRSTGHGVKATPEDRERYKKTRLFWLRTKFSKERPDGLPGYLTKAVELCASEELRKG